MERANSRKPFFSGGTNSTSRKRGAAGSARGWPGRTRGFPQQPKRQRHGRGIGGPRKLFVRHAARSMAGVLPKAGAPTITPRTGRLHRQRKTSRLDRRMFLVPGRAAALSLPRTIQGGIFPERRRGGFFHPI